MIKKLFSLIWTLLTDKNIKYNWTNLMWYLKKGYSYSDLQDGDRYILDIVKNMCYDLGSIEDEFQSENGYNPSDKYTNIITNTEIYLSEVWELLDTKYQEEVINNINKELVIILWKIWI